MKANYPRRAIPAAPVQTRPQTRAGHRQTLIAQRDLAHLSTGETYRDLDADYFTRRDPERRTKRLVRRIERLVTRAGSRGKPDLTLAARQKRRRSMRNSAIAPNEAAGRPTG